MTKLLAASPALLLVAPLFSQSPRVIEWKPGEWGASPPAGWRVAGDPKVVDSPFGKAMRFDGAGDGLFFNGNPLEGLSQFTLEAVFYPDSDGPPEQRFVHFGYANGDRVLLETRILGDKQWCLDTFIAGGKAGRPLIDRQRLHPADGWHHVAYVVRDGRLSNYIDGALELTAQADYTPVRGGEASLGVRLNRQSWFKGAIYSVRISTAALGPEMFTNVSPPTR